MTRLNFPAPVFRLAAVLAVGALSPRSRPAFADPPEPEPATGTIAGVVRFVGTVPEPKAIPVADGGTIRHSDLVVDAKTKGLRDVMAVLEDAPARPKVAGARPVLMDQVNWVFTPRVVAVRHGQAVRFDNSDGVNHSVQATSALPQNEFNVFVTPGNPIERVFDPQKTPVTIGCSLHGWMRAWVYVVRHPWFAVSDAQGKFRIEKVPPGKYTLVLTHPDTGLRERKTVEVQPGKTVELTVDWRELKKKEK